jgi:hypothetical protein
MSVLLVVLAFAAGLVVTLVRGMAADEARGRVQRRITASVEATIASLPPELQDEWADEWRGEIAAVISMPLTAALLARGLRDSARQFIAEAGLASASARQQHRTALKRAPKRVLTVVLRTAEAVIRRVVVSLAYGLASAVAGILMFAFAAAVLAPAGTAVADTAMFGVIAILALLEHEEYRAPVTPAGRLRAVLEGRDDELVLTAEQTREIEAMLESWGEQPPG